MFDKIKRKVTKKVTDFAIGKAVWLWNDMEQHPEKWEAIREQNRNRRG